MDHILQHPYPGVEQNGQRSYGGNQCWSASKTMQQCGCGVIAGMDLLLYLHQNRSGCALKLLDGAPERGPLTLEAYNRFAQQLRRRFLPVFPHLGLNAFVLAGGLNCCFWKYRIPLRARWGTLPSRLWSAVGEMLDQDIPVILAIGPNFPLLWGRHKLTLYRKSALGDYLVSCAVNTHYVTITGMEKKWLHVASWGKEYYIDRDEYARYVRRYSCAVFSNIVWIREKVRVRA